MDVANTALEKPLNLRDLRMASIDLDGTLLGPDLKISPRNRLAVEQLAAAGLQIAIATGRHYHATAAFARQLPDVQWLVTAQGGEVSDVARNEILARDYLPAGVAHSAATLSSRFSITPMLYGNQGVFTTVPTNEAIRFYEQLIDAQVPLLNEEELKDAAFFKVVLNADPENIDGLESQNVMRFEGTQLIRSHQRFLEVTPSKVSKATGLARLAEKFGIDASEVVSFGDAENDIPIFQWSGASFAMGHGWPRAKQSARWVAPEGDLENAFARAVDAFLET